VNKTLIQNECATEADRGSAGAGLARLLGEVGACIPHPSTSQAVLIERVTHLAERLTTERFQLAVLGQFKRGKSTLLNALLGHAILPTGVVPVTAVPTFLQAAAVPRLRVTYHDGRSEEFEAEESAALRDRLIPLVTEDGNPHNIREIARVGVFLPSNFLNRGVVLIDTPGVGSTHRHNTATADAVLPECDATLFVVSPDPPITALEIEFLSRIRETVAHLTVVLNKIDTLEPNDQTTSLKFLQRVLVEEAQLPASIPIFCLSARGALRALESDDGEALVASGFTKLEEYLSKFLATEKRATLVVAVARKASALLDDLQLETEITLQSLRLPIHDLEERLRTFEKAARNFENERRTATDLLAGDRARALQELEQDAEGLRAEGRAALVQELDQALGASDDPETVRARVTAKVIAFFDEALGRTVETMRRRLNAIFDRHQKRADELITLVRRTAADLLQISVRASESSEAFETRRDPFWVTTAGTVTLSPIPAGAFDLLLPARLRRRRIRRRLLEECEAVLVRNVENLRWATRQNLEDAFRRFSAELDEGLALSLSATRGAMQAALDRRQDQAQAVEAEVAEKEAALRHLTSIAAQFDREGRHGRR
jgi:GTP-binding protein EngB required for normal cell division